MQPMIRIVTKAIALGPLPYLILAAAILGMGVVLQMRVTTTDNLPGGRSVFGLMAQLGGAVGLFGLATLVFGGLGAGQTSGQRPAPSAPQHLPVSAFDARLAAATPGRVRPARVKSAAPQATTAPTLAKALRR